MNLKEKNLISFNHIKEKERIDLCEEEG